MNRQENMQFELTEREKHFANILRKVPHYLTEVNVIAAARIALGWRCEHASTQEYLAKQLANDPRVITIRDRGVSNE